MTPPPDRHPDDEPELPELHTVPRGAVAVFQQPRGTGAALPPGDTPTATSGAAPAAAPPGGHPPVPPATPTPAEPGATPTSQPPGPDRPAPPEIESPFLELFGPQARRAYRSTLDGTVIESREEPVPPAAGGGDDQSAAGRGATAPPRRPPTGDQRDTDGAGGRDRAARGGAASDAPARRPAGPSRQHPAPTERDPAGAVRPVDRRPLLPAQPARAPALEAGPQRAADPPGTGTAGNAARAGRAGKGSGRGAPANLGRGTAGSGRDDTAGDSATTGPAAGDTGRGTTPAGPPPARRPPRREPGRRGTPPARPRHKDRDPAIDLAITEIAGHLTYTANTVTAWYWLPEVRWAFRPDAERETLLSAIAEQYAGLAGFRLHLRRTTRPFPADEWARTVDANTPTPLPVPPGAPSWADHLVAAQHHLLSINHAEGQTFLGVTFARRAFGNVLATRLRNLVGKGAGRGERDRMARTVEQFDEVLGAFGMRGRRVTAAELEWLLYRSVALGMPPPPALSPVTGDRWERGDLLAFTEQIERYRTPYGSTVKLVNRLTGDERHVAVLSVGRMEPLEIPERHEPWLHFHERLPWAMELSSRIDVLGPTDSFRNLEHRLRMIRSQQADYAEHGMDAPPELERLAQRALHIGDEMTTGLPTDASRVHGWHRIAVPGATREECLERTRRLIQTYARELRISLQHPKNQDWLAREFIPGEPIANTGYLRRMPVTLLAAALPQAASTVGDRRGDLIGRTAGTCRRPVFLDLHFPMEVRERSGLAVFVAEPGGGKSTLLGALGYLAARRGVRVTLLDPSGPLARLAEMPELAPHSRVLNLTGSQQGTLAPYALIPTPARDHFADGPAGDREYEIAVSNARAERRMLVQDICSMLVPPQVAREASTATLLRHAVREVPAEESATLDDVVSCLRDLGTAEGGELANLLMDTAEMPLALLFFGSPPTELLGADAALTVITMAGLRLPDLKIEREYWSAEEALALPMLHTAHRLAVRRCYGGPMTARKLVGLDEAHFMEGWRSGRSFLVRLARDSRKWNIAGLVASQNPKDILGLDVQNLVSTVFVGRIAEDPEIAAEALRLLRVPTDVGYEQTLATLSAVDSASSARLGFREFVMRDVDARVQKIRVDVSYVPDLLRYLDTTPGAKPAPGVPFAADFPLDEPEA